VGHEGFNERIQVAVQDHRQIIEGELNAVIGHTVLGKVVGANFFVSFAGTDLGFALRGVLGGFFGGFAFEEAGAENGKGPGLVFHLGPLVGAAHNETRGLVEHLHGGIGGVDALAAGTGGAADRDLELVGFDFDVHFPGFGKDGNGAGAGVDAALRLGGGDALDAVDAALVLQAFVNVGAEISKITSR
jgi:hypothetical protein